MLLAGRLAYLPALLFFFPLAVPPFFTFTFPGFVSFSENLKPEASTMLPAGAGTAVVNVLDVFRPAHNVGPSPALTIHPGGTYLC